jgi:hypothetical protein
MIDKENFLQIVNNINFTSNLQEIRYKKAIKDSNNMSWKITEFPNKSELELNLGNIEGMSTAANCYIINEICKSMLPSEVYLNIGVWKGLTLIAGLINTECQVVGVDNFSQFKGPKEVFESNLKKHHRSSCKFYDKDYRIYFNENHLGSIDFYFYDGHHSYEHQYNAIITAFPYFSKRTILMVDDTNNDEPRNGTFDALNFLNVKYDIWFDQRTPANKYPTFWNGICIIELNK